VTDVRPTSANRILETALDLFASQSYDATSVQAMCDAAQIAKPTLYQRGDARADGACGNWRADHIDAGLVHRRAGGLPISTIYGQPHCARVVAASASDAGGGRCAGALGRRCVGGIASGVTTPRA
jgi:hypothetical protein